MGIAERVPRMQEELERLRAKIVELTKGFSTMKEGLVHISDFLEVRSTVGRHETEIASLRQARLDILSRTLSRGPAEGSRAPVSVCSGDRSTLPNFLKLFQTWTMAHDAENVSVTSEPIRAFGKERASLNNADLREKVNQSIAVWTGLVKGIERDKALFDMVITVGSLSATWKIVLSMVGESREAVQDKAKKEFEELPFEIGN